LGINKNNIKGNSKMKKPYRKKNKAETQFGLPMPQHEEVVK
tara:strand:+ start:500 stop:622 length:123 start_codon:yes stop_codon:yes gene_type:complete